jgi:hypothetical protein
MKIIENFLVLARFSALMGLLIIARFVSPDLADSALSEQEYAEGDPAAATEDPSEGRETPVASVTAWDERGMYAGGIEPEGPGSRRAALRGGVHRTPGFGVGYLRHRPRP